MRGNSGGALSVTQEEDPETGLLSDTIPLTMFSCPGAAGFKVRGPKYLQDKKKVYADPLDREFMCDHDAFAVHPTQIHAQTHARLLLTALAEDDS